MVADICMHDKVGNPHAHILLTLRDFKASGFGPKVRKWSDPRLVETWRASWAAAVNNTLERAGLDIRIDHRSHRRLGVDRTPTKHVGRMTPWNGLKVADNSLENEITQIERKLLEHKRESRAAEKLAAAQTPASVAAPPISSLPRTRRRRPARPQRTPTFTAGSTPTL
jgi:hypothetical protein